MAQRIDALPLIKTQRFCRISFVFSFFLSLLFQISRYNCQWCYFDVVSLALEPKKKALRIKVNIVREKQKWRYSRSQRIVNFTQSIVDISNTNFFLFKKWSNVRKYTYVIARSRSNFASKPLLTNWPPAKINAKYYKRLTFFKNNQLQIELGASTLIAANFFL